MGSLHSRDRLSLHGDLVGLPGLLAGLALAGAFGYDLATPGAPRLAIDLAGLILAAGLLTLALDVPAARHQAEAQAGALDGVAIPPRRWAARQVGLALIALGVVAAGRAVLVLWASQANWRIALPWWAGSVAACLVGAVVLDVGSGALPWWKGLFGAQPVRRGPGALESGGVVSPVGARDPTPARVPGGPDTGGQRNRPMGQALRLRDRTRPIAAALGALAVAGLALFLRLHRLDAVPPGIFIDETNAALDGLAILHGAAISPFGTGWYETPNGYVYLQAAVVGLLGPTLLALKLPAVVAGTLTALGAYCLGRRLFGTPAGLAAGLFLAFARWPLNMSRWGWNETFPPAAHVWAVYFLVRGARTRRSTDFALAGLILGLGMYSYLSIRLVLVAVAAYVAYRALVERGFLRAHAGRLALVGLLWAVTFAPLAVTYAKDPRAFLNRTNEVSIQRDIQAAGGKLDPLVENVRRHLLMFNVAGDRNPRHNQPGQPMLDPVMGVLLVLAAVRALALARDHRRGLLLLWIPAILLGGVLSALDEGPQGYRTLGVMPAVAILCGELLARVGQRLAELLARRGWPRPGAVGMPLLAGAALLVWSGRANYQSYFGGFAGDPSVYVAFNPLETAVARELAAAADPNAYYLSPRLFYFSPPRYFASPAFRYEPDGRAVPPYHLFQGPDDLPLPADGSRDAVLLWGPEWSGIASVLRELYPSMTVERVLGRNQTPLYERAMVPAAAFGEARGLMAVREWADGRSEKARVVDPAAGLPGDQSEVVWTGSLYVPKSGPRSVVALDGAPVLIDGQPAPAPVFLARGLHDVAVSQSGEQARAGLRLVWAEPSGPPSPVPATSLFARPAASSHGLLGTYYQGDRWEGPPLFRRVDPVVLFGWPEPEPVPGPLSVTWRGEIEIASPGDYAFPVESDDGARLWLDGKVVGESLKPDSGNFFIARVGLSAGRHPIRLDYFQRGGAKVISLRWIPPGQPETLVPPEVLWPAVP